MTTLRARSVLFAAAAVAGTLLMTACQSDDTAGSTGAGTTTEETVSAQAAAATKRGGVSGTFSGGEVAYLAPGTYTVTAGGKEQQFWIAEDTKIWGSGGVCGDAAGQAATQCTEAQLEKAARAGAVDADVVLKDGIAVTVTERHTGDGGADDSAPSGEDTAGQGGDGVSGTWLGTVSYLAPGKYTVSDLKDTQQQFWIAEDTEIWGVGGMCGDAEGQTATQCTEAELEAAAKAGTLAAEVEITDGIATRITEEG
jgi:hypothetical protein